jgi:predicted N-acetyltransferase YhbS
MSSAAAPVSPAAPYAYPIRREEACDGAAIDQLVLNAFGPGRFAKTAERIRETAALTAGFCVYEGEDLIGSVRLWAVSVGEARSVFLGPIAVDQTRRSSGLGGEMVRVCIEEAKTQGLDGVLLVGDPPYFSRFGFEPAPQAVLTGPVDRRRVMWLPITDVPPVGTVLPVA